MGLYRDSIEQLNFEYKDRSSISIFGRHATMLRLLVDSYEVRLRFENLLEEMQKGPMLFDDADLDFEYWADRTTWDKPFSFMISGEGVTKLTTDAFGIRKESPFAQTYANRLQDALGEDLNKINPDRFRQIVSSVVTTSEVIPEDMFERVIDANILHLRDTLGKIVYFKNNHEWKKRDYAQFNKRLYDEFITNAVMTNKVEKSHQKWRKGLVVEPDIEDCEQRRRELLLDLFKKDFFKALRSRIHVPAEDDLKFHLIQDDEMISDLSDTLKWYAAFKKICPRDKDGMFWFDKDDALGKYIYDNNIPQATCWDFFIITTLIEHVQQEMVWLQHPEKRPLENETLEKFVDRVKKIMLKAEDRNGEIIKFEDNKHNKCQYTFNVDGKGFCTVMDEVLENHADLIEDYLDGKMGDTALGVTKICPFIGCVVGLHIFNDEKVRNVEFEPAFQFVYGEKNEQGKKRSFIQKMSATKDIKDKDIFETIKTIIEQKKNELLEGKNQVTDL